VQPEHSRMPMQSTDAQQHRHWYGEHSNTGTGRAASCTKWRILGMMAWIQNWSASRRRLAAVCWVRAWFWDLTMKLTEPERILAWMRM